MSWWTKIRLKMFFFCILYDLLTSLLSMKRSNETHLILILFVARALPKVSYKLLYCVTRDKWAFRTPILRYASFQPLMHGEGTREKPTAASSLGSKFFENVLWPLSSQTARCSHGGRNMFLSLDSGRHTLNFSQTSARTWSSLI